MHQSTVLLSLAISTFVATDCLSQVPPEFSSALASRAEDYPQLTATWLSKHFQNTTAQESKDDPFAPDFEISEESPLKIVESPRNFWCVKQNDMGFRHGLVVLSKGEYRLMPLEYSCIASEVRHKEIAHASGSIRLGLNAIDCPDYEYQALVLIYRPELSDFYRLLKQAKFVPATGQTVWSGRPAHVFTHRFNGVVQTEYFFDAVLHGVFLGCRVRGPEDSYTIEVVPQVVGDRLIIESIVLTVRSATTSKLKSKSVCSNFKFDFDSDVSLRDMAVTFEPGMHISKKENGAEYEEFIYREDGSLEPLTDANRDELDPRATGSGS